MSVKYLNDSGLGYFWSKIKAYLSGAYVDLSTAQTVAGTKTFTASPHVKNNPKLFAGFTQGTAPASNVYRTVYWTDSGETTVASVQYAAYSSGGTKLSMNLQSLDGSQEASVSLFTAAADGSPYVTATPPSDPADDSNRVATTGWVRDATGNFACNAATASKLASSRTLSLSGDASGSASFDGSANADITVTRRACRLRNTSTSSTKTWFKVASYTSAGANHDERIVLLAEQAARSGVYGILRLRVRYGSDQTIDRNSPPAAEWLANNGFDLGDFVVVSNDVTNLTVELWVRSGYQNTFFTVLSEGSHLVGGVRWTLHENNSSGGASALPSGTAYQSSFALEARLQAIESRLDAAGI